MYLVFMNLDLFLVHQYHIVIVFDCGCLLVDNESCFCRCSCFLSFGLFLSQPHFGSGLIFLGSPSDHVSLFRKWMYACGLRLGFLRLHFGWAPKLSSKKRHLFKDYLAQLSVFYCWPMGAFGSRNFYFARLCTKICMRKRLQTEGA